MTNLLYRSRFIHPTHAVSNWASLGANSCLYVNPEILISSIVGRSQALAFFKRMVSVLKMWPGFKTAELKKLPWATKKRKIYHGASSRAPAGSKLPLKRSMSSLNRTSTSCMCFLLLLLSFLTLAPSSDAPFLRFTKNEPKRFRNFTDGFHLFHFLYFTWIPFKLMSMLNFDFHHG